MSKKTIIILLSLSVIITAFFVFVNYSDDLEVSQNKYNNDDIIVLIDPGHGGEDGGAVSSGGVIESNVNLSFSLKLKTIMNLNGFKTVLTRIDDSDLGDKSLETIAQRKKSDMYKRLELYNSDIHNVAISIHQNIFPADACRGTQVFYSTMVDSSKDLADNITNVIVSTLQNDNQRISKPTNGSIFLLDNAKVPAVIVECGFLSNKDEVNLLCDKEYQKKFSYCVYLGFLNTGFN
ncbi:MAG: N-acetylmuramoyl-L-alanine amidase [Oscillospiraceae bacterium]|nr:N-acetylmuramoyl-L-alanine amidase [Oscillospiraceae bacterium]